MDKKIVIIPTYNEKENIEKTDYCTRSKYRENTIYREALILLVELKVSESNWKYKKLYNEEFDPGSG